MRFDKKGAGLVKVGLGFLHEGGPGDPGLALGHNWNDRRGARSSWYLDSEGETYEGNKCLREGSKDCEYATGDVVAVELIEGLASFSVNYKKVVSDVKVTAWPVAFAVLMVFKGDRVTLLREERMDPEEYHRWLRTRPGIASRCVRALFCKCASWRLVLLSLSLEWGRKRLRGPLCAEYTSY